MLGLRPLPSKLQRKGTRIRERSISAGQPSTTALAGSTEAEQFTESLVAALPEEAPHP